MKSSHKVAISGSLVVLCVLVGACISMHYVRAAAVAVSVVSVVQDMRVEIMLQTGYADSLVRSRQVNDDLSEREAIQYLSATTQRIKTLLRDLADGGGEHQLPPPASFGTRRDISESTELQRLYSDALDEIIRGREVSKNLVFARGSAVRLVQRLTNVSAAASRRIAECSTAVGRALLWTCLVTMLLLSLLAWILHREIFREIRRILDYLQLLGDGDLSVGTDLPEHACGEVGELTSLVNRALDRSRDADRTKNRFLAAMSHEIRTPMNGVIGFLGNLRETPLNEQQRQYVRVIESSARSLLKVINGILDFSKLSAGKMELEEVAFDVIRLLEDCTAMTRQLVRGKSVRVLLEIEGMEHGVIRGDPTRLRQVLDNLLGNAAKFTDKGEIAVRLKATRGTDDILDVVLEVSDTGVGITPAQQEQLFKPFSQAEVGTTRKYGGTGLGLCIASSLVSLMGGQLTVRSDAGKGSTFSFALTVRTARPEEKVQLSGHYRIVLPPAAVRKFWALLVDDTPTNLFLLETICQSIGLPYRTAINGKEAVDLARQQRFDIVFMDIQMPVMDGYTAIREIRKLTNSGQTQIIALTASAFQEDVDLALGAGSTGFLAKPFERDQLLLCIAEHLDISVNRELREPLAPRDAPEDMSVRQMYDFMREQYEISLGEIKMILAQSVSDWRPLLDDLTVFARHSNWEEVRTITHRLKGQLASIGLPYLADQAAGITAAIRNQETHDLRTRIEGFAAELGQVFRAIERDVTVTAHPQSG